MPQSEQWELPKALRISDPKVLAKSEEMQAELAARANSPFANLSPQDHARARAVTMADELKRDLKYVNQQYVEALVSGDSKCDEYKTAQVHIAEQLAECYAVMGRFDLAAETTANEQLRNDYQDILRAINKDDSHTCYCAPGKDFVMKDIFSLKHNRVVSLIKCSGCGFLNAKPIPKHLAEQRAHRSKAAAMAAHLSPDDAKQLLTREGHTHEKLIGK